MLQHSPILQFSTHGEMLIIVAHFSQQCTFFQEVKHFRTQLLETNIAVSSNVQNN